MCDIHTMVLNWLIGLVRRVVGLVVSKVHTHDEPFQQFELE